MTSVYGDIIAKVETSTTDKFNT